jgi:regulator of protease activity HflC (stomatin/prohibitin superfamily)
LTYLVIATIIHQRIKVKTTRKVCEMADIRTYPFIRHFRAEPTAHVLRYKRGRLVAEGPGLAFWFSPVSAQAAEVPLDDRELPFLFHARSADFQELTVQGVVTYRFVEPARTAGRIDFSVDLRSGRWTEAPLEQITGQLTQLAQQFVIDELVRMDLRTILADGVAPVRDRIAAGLAGEQALAELGIAIAAVRVAAIAPAADVDKALQQPTREAIQQRADEAVFARRAEAVDKERAIAENELANRIELARRTEQLVGEEGANERRRAEEQAAARAIAAEATDREERMVTARKVEAVDDMEAVRLRVENERAEISTRMGAQILTALALRELAGQLGQVDHLTITPELLTPLLARLGEPKEG